MTGALCFSRGAVEQIVEKTRTSHTAIKSCNNGRKQEQLDTSGEGAEMWNYGTAGAPHKPHK
jgi:hypothetical protein